MGQGLGLHDTGMGIGTGMGKTGRDSAKGPGWRFGLYYWMSIADIIATGLFVAWCGYSHSVLSAILAVVGVISSNWLGDFEVPRYNFFILWREDGIYQEDKKYSTIFQPSISAEDM